jgi:hypothetical protein
MARKKLVGPVLSSVEEGYPKIPGFPHELRKAVDDQPYAYLAIFRNGWHVEFEGATVDDDPDWVHLRGVTVGASSPLAYYTLERGISVRVSEIIAVVDAPHGS